MSNSHRSRRGLGLPFLGYMVVVLWLAVGAAGAQSPPDPFERRSDSSEEPEPSETPRRVSLKERFLETEGWTFYHAIDRIPGDMRKVLNRVAGSDVVGPGEPIDTTDIAQHPFRTQHLYTAMTNELGVIVWFSGGGSMRGHAVIYDRKVGDACRYNLGTELPPVLPLRGLLRWKIHTPGDAGARCEYLPPSFF